MMTDWHAQFEEALRENHILTQAIRTLTQERDSLLQSLKLRNLDKVKTSDLIDELIARKISAHDYQLIYSNHIRAQLREHQERERNRSEEWRLNHKLEVPAVEEDE